MVYNIYSTKTIESFLPLSPLIDKIKNGKEAAKNREEYPFIKILRKTIVSIDMVI